MAAAKASRADKVTMGFAIVVAVLIVSAFVAAHLKPHVARLCYRIGSLSLTAQDYDSAISWLDRAIWLRPEFAAAYRKRAIARMKGVHEPGLGERPPSKADLDLAMKDFAMALQLNPRNPQLYHDRGYADWMEGNKDQALQDFTQAIQLRPGYSNAYFARGRLHRDLKQDDLAALDFTDCVNIRPDFTRAYENLSDIYESEGKLDLAIQDDDHLIQAYPKSGEGWNDRCWHRAIVGKLPEALADCKQSLELAPNEPNALDSLGLVYLKMKNSDLAIENYSAALAQIPKLPTSLYGRGMAKLQKGDSSGVDDLDAAKAIEPDIADKFQKLGVPSPAKLKRSK